MCVLTQDVRTRFMQEMLPYMFLYSTAEQSAVCRFCSKLSMMPAGQVSWDLEYHGRQAGGQVTAPTGGFVL